MAETVYYNDGSMDIILEEKHVFVEKMIRERLGEDPARVFTECIAELKTELEYEKEAREDIEKEYDSYTTLINDALDALREIKDMLSVDRINKRRVLQVVNRAYENLYKNT